MTLERYRVDGHWSEVALVTCLECDRLIWEDENETRSYAEMHAVVEAHEVEAHPPVEPPGLCAPLMPLYDMRQANPKEAE